MCQDRYLETRAHVPLSRVLEIDVEGNTASFRQSWQLYAEGFVSFGSLSHAVSTGWPGAYSGPLDGNDPGSDFFFVLKRAKK